MGQLHAVLPPISQQGDLARVYGVIETLKAVSSITDLDRLLSIILQAARETVGAEASSLMLLDHATDELYFHEVRGGSRQVQGIRLKAGQGIAGRVARTGRPLIVNDVSRSRFFYSGADRKTGFSTRQVLCVPLQVRKTMIGVLEAINKISGGGFGGQDLLLFNTLANQAAVAIENARLHNLAAYDGLTQVYTRRFFDQWFETEFVRLRRYRRDLQLLFIDIDHFKRVNDKFGHQAGDHVLAAMAQLTKGLVRDSDFLARYGGEEFILAMRETAPGPGRLAAERIRRSIETHAFEFEGSRIPVTVSIGLSSYRDDPALTPAGLIREADSALYQAKSGRNRVEVYHKEPRSID
jgi:diguanylate cyclase (GGDEF)-like protein